MNSLSECWCVWTPSRVGPLWFNSCPLNVCILCGWLWKVQLYSFYTGHFICNWTKWASGHWKIFTVSIEQWLFISISTSTCKNCLQIVCYGFNLESPIDVQSRLNTILDKNVHQNIKEEKQIPLTCCSQRKVFTPVPGHIILTQGSHYLPLLGQEESSDSLGQCCFWFILTHVNCPYFRGLVRNFSEIHVSKVIFTPVITMYIKTVSFTMSYEWVNY